MVATPLTPFRSLYSVFDQVLADIQGQLMPLAAFSQVNEDGFGLILERYDDVLAARHIKNSRRYK